MNEKELNDLDAEVLAGDSEDVSASFDEVIYLNSVRENLRIERDKIKSNYRMWKFVRDEEKLKECKVQIKKVRDCIDGVNKRLDELKA